MQDSANLLQRPCGAKTSVHIKSHYLNLGSCPQTSDTHS
jgi:hypothetical protein